MQNNNNHIGVGEAERRVIRTKSSSNSLPLSSSSSSHRDRISGKKNNSDRNITYTMNAKLDVESYDPKTVHVNNCVVEIIGRSASKRDADKSSNHAVYVNNDNDNQSVEEYGPSRWKKRCIKISWYVVIGAFLTACPVFAAGIVLGVMAYSDRPTAHLLVKPANIVLSMFFFLIGVGVGFLIFMFIRKRLGFWAKEDQREMVTDFSNFIHEEPTVVIRDSIVR
ncbi:uncharacterized protein LOC129270598 [Lytechinus pictus]|uniref:uncharacterized protein LOC129270598 n=1 Tax=Lytechinus pictus TaxID=7653 RepID=UPI00240DC5AC|nr:uncharacterized protein LOC129270598 [Lytechinus pictus]